MRNHQEDAPKLAGLRIVGGHFRGRRLEYGGDPRVRPMKDRVREAVFNLLGDSVRGTHALDLFAGTGALGLEALSRAPPGLRSSSSTIPRPNPPAERGDAWRVESRCEVITGNVFRRARWQHALSTTPWLVFSSPPYVFYVERQAEMLDSIGGVTQSCSPRASSWSRPTATSTSPCCPTRPTGTFRRVPAGNRRDSSTRDDRRGDKVGNSPRHGNK